MEHLKKIIATFILTIFIFSCSKDDGPTASPEKNKAPEISAQSFNTSEDVLDEVIIGSVIATDPEDDALTYSITSNSDNLFEITEAGALSLVAGQSLDFETAETHSITVQVSDGELSSTAEITINVTDIDENNPPVIENQIFETSEDIADDIAIGTVIATDDTALTFSIITNSDHLFEITEDGILSLVAGKQLNFETATSHTITVQASDGELSSTAEITINVKYVVVINPDAFITTWKTTTALETITIPVNDEYTYNYSVDWGDGEKSENVTGNATHTYTDADTYIISITGDFPAIYFNGEGDKDKIQTIQQWGTIKWKFMESAFERCSNLTYTATDSPDLTEVTSLYRMFFYTNSFNGDLNNWDVSSITNLSRMFQNATSFNGNIGNWDVSSVTNMTFMFTRASSFNQDLNSWNVSNVESMYDMFRECDSFNGDVSGWDVSSVTNMSGLFQSTPFNQDISNWDVSSVTQLKYMFYRATSFNGDLSNWDISSVRDTQRMFNEATSFNGDLSNWDTSAVVHMRGMFYGATSFSGDISNWDVSNVTNMYHLFFEASAFDNDLSNWDISSVTDMQFMFDNCDLSITNYDATLKAWSELATVPNDIELGAIGMEYCDEGETARNVLAAKGWTFVGDTKSTDCL